VPRGSTPWLPSLRAPKLRALVFSTQRARCVGMRVRTPWVVGASTFGGPRRSQPARRIMQHCARKRCLLFPTWTASSWVPCPARCPDDLCVGGGEDKNNELWPLVQRAFPSRFWLVLWLFLSMHMLCDGLPRLSSVSARFKDDARLQRRLRTCVPPRPPRSAPTTSRVRSVQACARYILLQLSVSAPVCSTRVRVPTYHLVLS
jgi:hypothetical protein